MHFRVERESLLPTIVMRPIARMTRRGSVSVPINCFQPLSRAIFADQTADAPSSVRWTGCSQLPTCVLETATFKPTDPRSRPWMTITATMQLVRCNSSSSSSRSIFASSSDRSPALRCASYDESLAILQSLDLHFTIIIPVPSTHFFSCLPSCAFRKNPQETLFTAWDEFQLIETIN